MPELLAKRLSMPDADIILYPACFGQAESDEFFRELLDSIDWQQETMRLWGKTTALPRLTAWHGDAGKSYTYSGITVHARPWTSTLLAIKSRIEDVAGVHFNSVLLNLYRHERDSVSWHSDDEPELGENPVIGSVSFGATRRFQFKHKQIRTQRMNIMLSHGSFLLMQGATQRCWLHQIPKSTTPHGPRVNLTFRVIHQEVSQALQPAMHPHSGQNGAASRS